MCTVCGCGDAKIEGKALDHHHDHDHHHHHHGHHDHHHHHHHDHGSAHQPVRTESGDLHYGHGEAGVHVSGMDQGTLVRIERDILGKNDHRANHNRARMAAGGILSLNLLSSPGSGKTSLLVSTLEAIGDDMPTAVIEGDQQTSNDADRIRATGRPAVQVNTGKGCHLDAEMVDAALTELAPPAGSVLFIENVGNLVCPAAFDLGESYRVVVAGITEGEDKPLKYPDMFASADLLLVNKIDLLPHLDYDVDLLIENARKIRPGLPVLRVSAKSGEGMSAWIAWIRAARELRQAAE